MQRTTDASTVGKPGLPRAWGVTEQEWAAPVPCDEHARPGWERLMRGVDCDASPADVWPWLCQLRVAPYSYDLLDNAGRRSPRELDPHLADLAVGQTACTIFTIRGFVRGESLTLQMNPGWPTRMFGALWLTYAVLPAPRGSRLVAVIQLPRHPGLPGRAVSELLAWGDLVMMRKQLLTLAELAARDTAGSVPDIRQV